MNPITPWKRFGEVQEQILHGNGAFLVAVDERDRPNAMTIGWLQIGTVWSRPVCHVLVRPSRYTHRCIAHSGAFTVNVPLGTMAEELAFCGSRSGRDVDKFAELSLRTILGTKVRVPLLTGCAVAYECRLVAHAALAPDGVLDEGIRAKYYPRGDFHTLFFGEIVAAWEITA
ncbi:flavin reductase family protein [Candidatus Bipolaricaulota bacterium]|nr:flavin reductase family protein [Candidatus Bipolaricaulota bacterium]